MADRNQHIRAKYKRGIDITVLSKRYALDEENIRIICKDIQKRPKEIVMKFNLRAFDKSTRKMYDFKVLKREADFSWFDDKGLIFMLSTNKKDKNGKEIFVGDVVHYDDIQDVSWGVVVMTEGGFEVDGKNQHQEFYCLNTEIDSDELEVVTNIYEHDFLT